MSSVKKQFEAWWNTERMATAFDSFRHVAEEAFLAGHAASGREELLEACEAGLSNMNYFKDDSQLDREVRQKLEAAIKKARGEQ